MTFVLVLLIIVLLALARDPEIIKIFFRKMTYLVTSNVIDSTGSAMRETWEAAVPEPETLKKVFDNSLPALTFAGLVTFAVRR